MKILVTGTAGFIGYHLTRRLFERGDEVVELDNINDCYDVNLNYAKLNELGINKDKLEDNQLLRSSTSSNHKFIKENLEDSESINKLFKEESFNAVCNLVAPVGVRYSIANPHVYIGSRIYEYTRSM